MPMARQDTADAILSYYHSADADQPDGEEYGQELSGPCSPTSSSISSSDPNENDVTVRTSRRPQLRVASPTAGSSTAGAVMRTDDACQGDMATETPRRSGQNQMEKKTKRGTRSSDSGGGPRNNLRTGGRPFVAPQVVIPQAAAPVPSFQPSIPLSHPLPSDRARSAFDTSGPKAIGHVPRKSSREVAIIGTTSFPGSASVGQHQPNNPSTEFLRLPIFQIPQPRSPSPGISDISDSGCSSSRGRQRKDALAPVFVPVKEVKETTTPVRTPSIGEPKYLSDRLVGSLVVNLPPQSPSPSPLFSSPHSSTQDLMSPRTNTSSPLTPSTALTSPAATPSPYLYYQPGLHATAGPLPPPPQAVFNVDSKAHPPPRPPRHSPIQVRRKDDLESMKQVLQLPPHVAAALRAKCAPSPTEKQAESTGAQKPTTPISSADSPSSSHESFGSDSKPHHVREGAFPPSRILDSQPLIPLHEGNTASSPRPDQMDDLVAFVDLAIDDVGITKSCDVPPPNIVEPPRGYERPSSGKGLEIRHTDNLKINLGRNLVPERHHVDPVPSSPRSDESAAQGWVDADKTITLSEEAVPPVPAKNDLPALDTKLAKNALNMKRYSSLPRTPSLVSLNRPSAGSRYSYGTPSPSITHYVSPPKPPVRKTKTANPPALYFADVAVKRTVIERSIGYAYKINELYNCDCGLGDWIAETRYKALHPHSSAKRSNVNSLRGRRAPSTSSPSIAPRHISQSSTDSGVTFPRRADAYSATDLAPRISGDASPPNAPPPLPYPALAATPRGGPSRASTMIATSSSSSSRSAVSPSLVSKSPGSFFASLGRKASLKKEKPLTPPSLVKTLSRSPPRNGTEQSTPRPANLPPVAQSVPGGPRAPPNRMQRSQTIVIASQNSVNSTSPQRSSTVARRPSLFGARGSAQKENNLISETEFSRQVDKLAALLPKADRNVLAIYLRHTGQDILAIGQYLEDEKNGTLRYT